MRPGRPPKGNARRVTLSVKVTEREKAELEAKYGSAYAGLRRAVEVALGEVTEPMRSEPAAPAVKEGKLVGVGLTTGEGMGTVVVDEDIELNVGPIGKEPVVKTSRHSHKPATLFDARFEAGVKYETWSCACGALLPERKAK